MQSLENPNVSTPLVLTNQQRNVLEALQNKQTDKYPLSAWYLGALYALDNHYNPDRIAQAAHSLRELLEKLPRVVQGSDVQGPPDFKGMRRNINNRIFKDKERYPEGWKNKKIDGRLDKTLRKIENYFECNQQPTRDEQMQQAVATIDPMDNSLDSRVREKKRNQLYRLWKNLEGFTHHKSNPDIVEFSNCLKELEHTIFDLLAPITAQDQREIQTILSLSDRDENDVERMFSLIERRGANFVFFFTQISEKSDVTWLPFLEKKGYFANPPKAYLTDDDSVIFPFWWPIRYLAKISNHAPNKVIKIVLQLPKVNNPLVYDGILDVALQLSGEKSVELNPKILEYTNIDHQPRIHKYGNLLAHWTVKNQTEAALELSKVLVAFVPDPQSEEKQKLRRENPMSWGTLLHPEPRINPSEYSEIMTKGVCSLAESEPYEVARLLIYATSNMFRLQIHQDELDREQDFSNIRFQRLYGSDKSYDNPDKALVYGLTFACEQVFEKAHDAIADLDNLLRKQKWKIFKRLRQHLYAQYPNEKTKPWIRELLLERKYYHEWQHTYEFQQMIRSACEHFGETLLTKEERAQIFDAIRSGPRKEDFRERLGEEFTEERFLKRQHYFHCRQFAPFASVLFGKYKTYFQELTDEGDASISDDDYLPFKTKSGSVSKRNPRSLDDLANLTDVELLAYINEWENEDEFYGDDEFVEINIEALANTFQTLFKESIIPDPSRFRFWMENREKIERPIYVRMMINAMQASVQEKSFKQLNEWLTFCDWVVSHPDKEGNADYRRNDESRENPNWFYSRRAVGDFISACLEERAEVPVSARGHLAKLLGILCAQFDSRLDRNFTSIDSPIDALTEGINSTRGRALEDLVKFGFWLRRHDSENSISEVTTILKKRFASEIERALTLPEYAILGRNYPWIIILNKMWAIEHKTDFFPQGELPAWVSAFESLVRYSELSTTTFKILQEDFDFALRHLSNFKNCNRFGADPINILGEHLFTYYLWELYPLRGDKSLLEKYYQQTKSEQKHWGNLFKDIGHRLSKIRNDLDQNLKEKVINFFEWRLEQEEPMELKHFTFWLQAECLDAEWRLKAYSKVLDVCEVEDWGFHFKTLCEMLPNHTAKVIECFFKLTERVKKDNFYIQTEEAKTILKAGCESSNEKVRRHAADARENLLKSGRFVLPDLED